MTRSITRRRLVAAIAAAVLAPAAVTAALAQTHGQSGHAAAAPLPTFTAGSIVIQRPWTRATPAGSKVAGGFLVLRNTGTLPDRLIGGSLAQAPRVEVHEMVTTDGMMRMREVTGGLVIPPGATVELKPGGYHMMFMDLSQPIRQGARLSGTLVFERAGTVTIDYEIAPVGAPAPGAPGGSMPHNQPSH